MARQKQMDRVESEMTQAWQIANFVRAKKLPSLKSLLSKREPSGKPKTQTPQQMKTVLNALGMRGRPMGENTKQSLKYIKVQ